MARPNRARIIQEPLLPFRPPRRCPHLGQEYREAKQDGSNELVRHLKPRLQRNALGMGPTP